MLTFEFLLFVVFAACFTCLTSIRANESTTDQEESSAIVLLAVCWPIIITFSLFEVLQMRIYRKYELLGVPETSDWKVKSWKVAHFFLFNMTVGLPVWLFLFILKRIGGVGSELFVESCCQWGEYFSQQKLYDPLTMMGLPKAYRKDPWNWFDVAFLVCVFVVLSQSASPVSEGAQMDLYKNTTTLALFFLYFQVLGYLKNFQEQFAAFINVLTGIITALSQFLVVMGVVLCMFAHIFYFRNHDIPASDFGFHDDGAPSPFRTLPSMFQALFLLAFVGDYDADAYPTDWDKSFLDGFIFLVVVVLSNMLIAIVSDEYDRCVALAHGLFWMRLLDTATECTLVFPPFPQTIVMFFMRTFGEISTEKLIQDELVDGEIAEEQRRGRTLDISARVNAHTAAKLKRMETSMDARLGKIEKALTDALSKVVKE